MFVFSWLMVSVIWAKRPEEVSMDWDKIAAANTARKVRELKEQGKAEAQQQARDAARKLISDCLRDVVYPVLLHSRR
jgi:hypothetical protein